MEEQPGSMVFSQLDYFIEKDLSPRLILREHCFGCFNQFPSEVVTITDTFCKKPVDRYDYSQPFTPVPQQFFYLSEKLAQEIAAALKGVELCILYDILSRGDKLIFNTALRTALMEYPKLSLLYLSHYSPTPKIYGLSWPKNARFLPLPNTTYLCHTPEELLGVCRQFDVLPSSCRLFFSQDDLFAFLQEKKTVPLC
ncbi:hypothetical protein H8705_02220 [Oscillospiraceae bacterium NSJ-64]|uniref:Uncharacterized protein n=2 Tax=Youxingia wuxianensis TaxID=2763678 RepID=A0A926IG14_9FIRM|nr:hypothetical protein [Youxingia wuxianensis]